MFLHILDPDWAPGPVQMCRDRRDIAGRALKVILGYVFVEEVDFSRRFGSTNATYSFLGPFDP